MITHISQSRKEFGIRSRSNIQTVMPSRLEGDGEVIVALGRQGEEIGNVEDVLSELVVYPCNRVAAHGLQRR